MTKNTQNRAHRLFALALACAALVGASALPTPAAASPTSTGWTWSWGQLTVSAVVVGDDNDYYAEFKNADGTAHSKWLNSAGADICGNNPRLRVSRSRTNYKEMVDTLNLAGLSRRTVWVAYEPTNGVCYVKSIHVGM